MRSIHKISDPLRKVTLAILAMGTLGLTRAEGSFAAPIETPVNTHSPNGSKADAAPFATARPNAGVPFGSMMTVEGKNGRTTPAPPPELPLASQPMSQEEGRVQATFDRMDDQISDRLKGLAIANGNLKPPKIGSQEAGIVDQLSNEEIQIKLLDARNRHLAAAIKAWSTAYDPHKEQVAANEKIEEKEKQDKNASPSLLSGPMRMNGGASEVETLRKEIEDLKAHPAETPAYELPKQDPYPIVTETSADYNGRMTANVLVPYVGALDNVVVGDSVQDGVTIAKITEKTVTIKDARTGRIVPLGWGNQVPKTRPIEEDASSEAQGRQSTKTGGKSQKRSSPVIHYSPPIMPPLPTAAPEFIQASGND